MVDDGLSGDGGYVCAGCDAIFDSLGAICAHIVAHQRHDLPSAIYQAAALWEHEQAPPFDATASGR